MADRRSPEEMTLAEHAEAWWREQGKEVPPNRQSPEWETMYLAWWKFAFEPWSVAGRSLCVKKARSECGTN